MQETQKILQELKEELHKEDLEFMQQAILMARIDGVLDRVAAKHGIIMETDSEREATDIDLD